MSKRRILYVDDMPVCEKKRRKTLNGAYYYLDWRRTEKEGRAALEDLSQYDAVIFDVNLNYDSSKPDEEQTTEGLGLIKLARRKSRRDEGELLIFCISTGNYGGEAMKAGADVFMWKWEFFSGKGKENLDGLLRSEYEG